MPDRGKVIKGLEICRHRVISQENCKECPYIYDGRAKQSNCEGVLHWDALELLKEQENAYRYLLNQFVEVQNQLNAKPEIVRCKDCIDRRVCAIARKHDGFTYNKFDPDWFCADGERMSENGNT